VRLRKASHGRWRLRRSLRKVLISWLATREPTVQDVVDFCRMMGIEVPSTEDAKRFIWQNRKYIDAERLEITRSIMDHGVISKRTRIKIAEDKIRKLDEFISQCDDPELLVRLMEQQRKLLEYVSHEAGEWNVPEGSKLATSVDVLIQRVLTSSNRKQLKEGSIEGEYTEVGDGQAEVGAEEADI
jgi:hypothetical protein